MVLGEQKNECEKGKDDTKRGCDWEVGGHTTHTMKIVPPNFGFVEEQIYRSGEPTELNFPFLETLKLKMCLSLSSEGPNSGFESWLLANDVELVAAKDRLESTNGSNLPFPEELCIDLLQKMLNPDNYPILVCDGMGRYRTGTIIGCLRKLQRWNLASILTEYRRYAGNKGRIDNEQFIELFDIDLVTIPENTPSKYVR
eukprot:TRINITY_DN4708_c0_g1_i2.p1 TRINITY_DN4708_c0_g1~~TRINITY_DN4708_c0_g1_i2.p1  ORF type:complete len:199 (+),score=43.20 TRINITY_DN4708_c0_g1_i2:805-1401(+)